MIIETSSANVITMGEAMKSAVELSKHIGLYVEDEVLSEEASGAAEVLPEKICNAP